MTRSILQTYLITSNKLNISSEHICCFAFQKILRHQGHYATSLTRFNVVCTVHHIAIYIDQLDAQILVISLYFPLGALHVSDSLLVHHQRRS